MGLDSCWKLADSRGGGSLRKFDAVGAEFRGYEIGICRSGYAPI